MQTKLLMTLFFLSTTISAKEVCSTGKIKYTYKQKEKIEVVDMCEDINGLGEFVYSPDCKGLECKVLKDPFKRPVNLKKYSSSIGSPGFKVCRELKGSPQIIKYQFKSKAWKQDSRCIFNKKSFVSNAILMKIWKDYILY
jgi:hypothetical protein